LSPLGCSSLCRGALFSIRAPIRRPGRLHISAMALVECSFNPRPDPKTGATLPRSSALLPEAVSIRAPIRRPGRLGSLLKFAQWFQFQSAPRSEDRGDTPATLMSSPQAVSIRAPIRRPGRPINLFDSARLARVSIRAPIRRPGRLKLLWLVRQFKTFQSAPRSEDRGDSALCPTSARMLLFQSAPRSEDRGDFGASLNSAVRIVSIRAPIRRPGRPKALQCPSL